MAQMVKNLPAVQESWVQFPGWEDPLEKAMATHSSIHVWRIPMDRGTWQATVQEVSESDTAERPSTVQGGLSLSGIRAARSFWARKWLPEIEFRAFEQGKAELALRWG